MTQLEDILKRHYKILSKSISKENFTTLNQTFKQLYVIRKDVENLTIDFAKTYSKYTQSIAFMLMGISNLSDSFKNKELSNTLYTYSIILMYKESIGQKRAALSALFSKEKFSKEIFEYFLTSNTMEKIYLKSFLRSTDDPTKNLYLKTLDDESIEEVKAYESLAMEKGLSLSDCTLIQG